MPIERGLIGPRNTAFPRLGASLAADLMWTSSTRCAITGPSSICRTGGIVGTLVFTNYVSYFYTNFNRTNDPLRFYRAITNN